MPTAVETAAREAAKNAPLFIETFFDGCEKITKGPDVFVPGPDIINAILLSKIEKSRA